MTKIQMVRKPPIQVQDSQPRNIQRSDAAPAGGYALVVDGHFKIQFESDAAAQTAAKELLGKFPVLQVAVYDASSKARTLIKL